MKRCPPTAMLRAGLLCALMLAAVDSAPVPVPRTFGNAVISCQPCSSSPPCPPRPTAAALPRSCCRG